VKLKALKETPGFCPKGGDLVLVRIEVFQEGKPGALTTYEVPPGSWIADPHYGMLPVPNTLERQIWRSEHRDRNLVVVATPLNPAEIPPIGGLAHLYKLVGGTDKRWGRNGWEWMGCHREKQGGTALDRAQEFAVKAHEGWMRDGPVQLTTKEIAVLLER